MNFVLLDSSTLHDPAFGGALDATTLKTIAEALTVYCNRDVAAPWGGAHTVRMAANAKDFLAGDVACTILDALPNAPQDVAYHDIDGNAIPDIFLARSQCNSLTSGADSVSGALAHEFAETIGDPACNRWVFDGQSKLYALETCDPVQEASYDIGGISVANFVFPTFFAPGSKGPFDYSGVLSAPLSVAKGGYQILRTGPGAETQIYGTIAAHRLPRKSSPNSRTFRRGMFF